MPVRWREKGEWRECNGRPLRAAGVIQSVPVRNPFLRAGTRKDRRTMDEKDETRSRIAKVNDKRATAHPHPALSPHRGRGKKGSYIASLAASKGRRPYSIGVGVYIL